SAWLALRKHTPPRSGMSAPNGKPVDETPLKTGAAHVLARLEGAEALAYRRLEEALATGDALETKVARGEWLRLSEGLRRFDASLDASRRASETVPLAEAKRTIAYLVTEFTGSVGFSLSSMCPALAGLPTPGDVWRFLERGLRDAIVS